MLFRQSTNGQMKKEKTHVLSDLNQQIDTKKWLLMGINDLYDEKAYSITAIWNFEKQNYFLKKL